MPRVFVSYSHDSPEHAARVTALVRALRGDGVDARFDRHEHRVDDWAGWMREQIVEADGVLCVCTPTYRDRFEGRTRPGDGDGVTWEGGLVRTLLVQRKGDARAVLLKVDGRVSADVVPFELGNKTRYTLDVGALAKDADYGQLLAHLHGRSDEAAGPVDKPPDWLIKARRSVQADLDEHPGHSDRPTDSEAAAINGIVNEIIRQLRDEAAHRGRLEAWLTTHRAAAGLAAVLVVAVVGAWAFATHLGGQALLVDVRCPTLHADAPFVLWTAAAGPTTSDRLAAALRRASDAGALGLHLPVPWPDEPSEDLRAALAEAHARQPPLVVTALQTEASPREPLPGLHLLTLYKPQGLARFTVGGAEVDGSPSAAWPCEGADREPTEPFALAGLALGLPELACTPTWSDGWLAVGVAKEAQPRTVGDEDLAGRWALLDGIGMCEKLLAFEDPCGGRGLMTRCELAARLANSAWAEEGMP
jgi:hypothetical protein